MDGSIRNRELALERTPPGHPDRASNLRGLAGVIMPRFDQAGDRTDLDAAIEYLEESLQLNPPGHPDRSDSLEILAVAIFTRYGQDGERANLDTAIIFHEEALRLRPPGHPDHSSSLNNLGLLLKARFDLAEDRVDLETAIAYLEEALQLEPPGHSIRSATLGNLADALQARPDLSEDRADLDTAIKYHEEALQLCPPGDPTRASRFRNLANAMSKRFDQTRSTADVDAAIGYHQELCIHDRGNLELRLCSSLSWIRLAQHSGHPSLLHAFTTALELLDTLVMMSSSLDLRRSRILDGKPYSDVQSLASDAAAVALDQGRPRRAVELLEQGRGILLGQLDRYRTAIDDLWAASPEMADEFTELSSQLERFVNRESAGRMDAQPGISGPGRYVTFARDRKTMILTLRLTTIMTLIRHVGIRISRGVGMTLSTRYANCQASPHFSTQLPFIISLVQPMRAPSS